MNQDMVKYYHQRAKEYEKIYHKPERQSDLEKASLLLQNIFRDKNVLELAAGTGYWTEKIAHTARQVLATDINQSVLDIAASKKYISNNVSFQIADIYKLSFNKKFESLFAGFLWSHLKIKEHHNFLKTIQNTVHPGGLAVIMDNLFVADNNRPITHTDEEGNTYQTRELEDRSRHLVLKNFPTESYLRELLNKKAINVQYYDLKYYWILCFQTLE